MSKDSVDLVVQSPDKLEGLFPCDKDPNRCGFLHSGNGTCLDGNIAYMECRSTQSDEYRNAILALNGMGEVWLSCR